MTATQKYEAFCKVALQVRAIERRARDQRIQREAQAVVAARFAELEKQRDQVRKAGAGFSILK